MEPLRKPYQGITNIIKFNRHLYLLSAGMVLILMILTRFITGPYLLLNYIIITLVIAGILISLVVSFYIYDLSGFYKLNWLNELPIIAGDKIVNINAGFDETSQLLLQRYLAAELIVFDFYDPLKHTEVSIKRARKAYLPFSGTIETSTSALPLENNSARYIFLIFAAHEIRKEQERDDFFKELKRILKPGGKIILVEHLRDIPNFLAYNMGFFHFVSRLCWQHTFSNSGLSIQKEIKITPFISNFILEKDGSTT